MSYDRTKASPVGDIEIWVKPCHLWAEGKMEEGHPDVDTVLDLLSPTRGVEIEQVGDYDFLIKDTIWPLGYGTFKAKACHRGEGIFGSGPITRFEINTIWQEGTKFEDTPNTKQIRKQYNCGGNFSQGKAYKLTEIHRFLRGSSCSIM
eukprot:gene709-90_t